MLFDVDGMQLNQAIDESPAHARRVIGKGGKFRRNPIAYDDPAPALHDEEDRADDGGIFAKVEDFGRGWKDRMDRLEHFVLTRHVVRLGRNRTERSAPQHIFTAGRAQQVGEIRMTAWKLLYSQDARRRRACP